MSPAGMRRAHVSEVSYSSSSYLKVAWNPFATNASNTHESVSVYSIFLILWLNASTLVQRNFLTPRDEAVWASHIAKKQDLF